MPPRKLDRIVQLGTQQRSDPLQAELKEFLHEKKELGEIKYAQVCRFGPRQPIGKRATPLEIPKTVNYDLWLGPARDSRFTATSSTTIGIGIGTPATARWATGAFTCSMTP